MAGKQAQACHHAIYLLLDFLTLGTFALGLTVGILSGFNLSRLNPFGQHVEVNRSFVVSFAPFFATWIFFALLYKVGPNTSVETKPAIAGASFTAIVLGLAGRLYTWYASNIINYEAIYGALAAVPLFLLWLYILWVICLFGSLLAWRLQQGFQSSELWNALSQEKRPSALSVLRLQGSAAGMIMSVIYLAYQKALRRDAPISEAQIAHCLGLSCQDIRPALRFLEEESFVQCVPLGGLDAQNRSQFGFLPLISPDNFKKKDLQECLNKRDLLCLDSLSLEESSRLEWKKHLLGEQV